jgi:hypothetical protein
MLLGGGITTFFGVILNGIPGAIIILINVVVLAYAAWGTYRLKIEAWWCAFLWNVIYTISIVYTFSRGDMIEFYANKKLSTMTQGDGPWIFLISMLPMFAISLAYLFYIKKYFKPFQSVESQPTIQ